MFSQNYLVDFNLKSLKYDNDSIIFDGFKEFSVAFNNCSNIIELCQLKKNTFGIQFEILKSCLGDTSRNISAYIIYKSDMNHHWEKIYESGFNEIILNEENPLKKLREQKNLPPALLKYAQGTRYTVTTDSPVRLMLKFDLDYKTNK